MICENCQYENEDKNWFVRHDFEGTSQLWCLVCADNYQNYLQCEADEIIEEAEKIFRKIERAEKRQEKERMKAITEIK